MQKFARIDIAFNNAGISHTAAVVDHALNFNYFRDYNPTQGRYIESDPLGASCWHQHLWLCKRESSNDH